MDTLAVGLILSCLLCITVFCLINTKLLPQSKLLPMAWYFIVMYVFYCLKLNVSDMIENNHFNDLFNGMFTLVMAAVNAAYLHICLSKRSNQATLDTKSILVVIPQCILLMSSLTMLKGSVITSVFGVITSLLILVYSLHYVYSTKASNHNLLLWQFIKFSLYCGFVPSVLRIPDILIHIFLLLIAVFAIFLGFRLNRKPIRIYGLVLSLVDVVTLVLFNIDYSDSLQFSLGIILCGALCFGISFLYSKLSKTMPAQPAAEATPAE
jgi:uncharacterized membrane protein